jgi:GcrA cell cycle regulator
MPARILGPEPIATASILTLAHEACRWPIGDPQDAGFGYCGRSRGLHVSYCDHHACVSKPERSTRRTEADLIRQFDRVASR